MTKRLRIAIFLAVALTAIITFGLATKLDAQKGTQKDTATLVKRGVMTERQRGNSKLFSRRRLNSRKLTDFTRDEAEGEVNVTSSQEYGSFDFASQPTLNEYLRDQTCDADVIILGKAISKDSQLTPEETYIFTDYTFVIDKLLKDDKSEPLNPKKEIIVARGGGKVNLDGRVITFNDTSFKPIVIGDQYLLFLKRISETGDFQTIGGSTMTDNNGKLQTLTDPHTTEVLQGVDLTTAANLIESYVVSYKCSSKEVR